MTKIRRVLTAIFLVSGVSGISHLTAQALPFVEVFPELNHPEPRAGIGGRRVMSTTRLALAGEADAAVVYDLAREIPRLLDGLHSYCNSGRSLLTCFEQPVGARCDYCMLVVRRVHQLHRMGHSLEFIRRWHVEPVAGVNGPLPRSPPIGRR